VPIPFPGNGKRALGFLLFFSQTQKKEGNNKMLEERERGRKKIIIDNNLIKSTQHESGKVGDFMGRVQLKPSMRV
jgi:hypothetical protein